MLIISNESIVTDKILTASSETTVLKKYPSYKEVTNKKIPSFDANLPEIKENTEHQTMSKPQTLQKSTI